MRRFLLRRIAVLTGILAFMALVRLLPAVAAIWATNIARPGNALLRALGAALPFSLLEWGAALGGIAAATGLMLRGAARGLRFALARLFRRACTLALALALLYAALWYPLYFAEAPLSRVSASAAQLEKSCAGLIDALNESALEFTDAWRTRPVKAALFPEWMEALSLNGIYAFATGEAFVSARLAPAALPFVAVHEEMHANGIAGEGAANLAAWKKCRALGGEFADSARLWALKYSMAALYRADEAAWRACAAGMRAHTARAFREFGGWSVRREADTAADRACAALGIAASTGDYDFLAVYLASREAL